MTNTFLNDLIKISQMKTNAILILLIAVNSFSCTPKVDVEKEKAAIMVVMEEETAAYYANDIDRWGSAYARDSTLISMSASNSGFEYHRGWESLYSGSKPWFTGNKGENKEVKKPVEIRVYKDNAWVVFNNKTVDDEAFVTCFLEKKDGLWKIVYRNNIWSGSYFQADYLVINSISYAKSLGKSVEDIAAFSGNQFKTGWNLDGFTNGVLIYW
jgi:hypothetical protein